MKEIDDRGHFETDDEVGAVFKLLKEAIEKMSLSIEEDNNE